MTDLPQMKRFPLVNIKPEFLAAMEERSRQHAEVVARGPIDWQVRTVWDGSNPGPPRTVSALYARDAVEKFAAGTFGEAFDDITVTVEVTGPDGTTTTFEVDTEVVRQRIVMEVQP